MQKVVFNILYMVTSLIDPNKKILQSNWLMSGRVYFPYPPAQTEKFKNLNVSKYEIKNILKLNDFMRRKCPCKTKFLKKGQRPKTHRRLTEGPGRGYRLADFLINTKSRFSTWCISPFSDVNVYAAVSFERSLKNYMLDQHRK